ncbi:hypothetical protein [Hymenobacter sp.]|uniref:hypothetical protein n=1 Tax=Hymenobacter sp. TaxID=1898978 RepID=UPI002EDA54EB
MLVALAGGAQAQRRPVAFPAPTPAPIEDAALRRGAGHSGSYQGLDGIWHAVQIEDWQNDRVYMSDAGSTYKAYSPTELRRFVVMGDTVVAVHDFVVPIRRSLFKHRPRLVPVAFARQLYRGGSFQLLDYDPPRPATLVSALSSRLLLRRGQEAWQVLPTNTAKFNQLMLTLLSNNLELAAGLRANQYRLRRDAAQLLERYTDWQTRQFLESTARPTR